MIHQFHAILGTPEVTADINVDGVIASVWPDFPQSPAAVDCESAQFAVPPYMGDKRGLVAFETMPNLQICQLLTIGFEDVLAVLPESVTVCNAKGVHEESTAELAIALILAGVKGFPGDLSRASTGQWHHHRRGTLSGANVVILGAGGVAQAIFTRLAPFGSRVTMFARSHRGNVKPMSQLGEHLAKADVLIIALPLNDETVGLVDEQMLCQLPDGAMVVNVARGPVMQTAAVIAQAQDGRLDFALDVVDPEPLPPGHPLWQMPNVIITPHVGGNTDAFPIRARRLVREQLQSWVMGAPLVNVVRQGV